VDEVLEFGRIVLVVAAGSSLAVLSSKFSERIPIPAPALFLLAAALASDLVPSLSEHLSTRDVERIGVVALIVILFDGGMIVGWRRFRGSLLPIASLGVLGTFGTAAAMAVFAHYLLDFSWTTAGILGAALAPTDPAVMFSVLGNREIGGRSGTILESESGVNDPVGIALVLALIELEQVGEGTPLAAVAEFCLAMGVGIVAGVAGGAGLLFLMRRVSLPGEGLYPIRTLAAAGVIYGAATLAHGSGFLAVFVAGLLIADERTPFKREIERFHTSLASLAEIVVFVALGLTIDLTNLMEDLAWLDGLMLAALLAFVARPLVAAPLLAPVRLRAQEKLFVIWGGLRGAVPILLATFALLAGVDDAERIYDIVFVVVAFSVLVQGSSLFFVAGRLGIPMKPVEPEPWDLSIRLREEPERQLERFVVKPGAPARGKAIRDVSLGGDVWISLIVHDGEPVQPRGSYVFQPGDEVLILLEHGATPELRRLFGPGRGVAEE